VLHFTFDSTLFTTSIIKGQTMKTGFKYTLAAGTLALLAACGGGGGDSSYAAEGSNNPLAKYAGTYYVCEDNEKLKLTLTPEGSVNLNLLLATDIYSNENCTGKIIGSYRWTSPVAATYTGQTTVTMPPISLLPFSDKVDEIKLSSSGLKAELTGTSVQGNCVKYSYTTTKGSVNRETCFELTLEPITSNGALYQTSDKKYLIQFVRENGIYEAETIASKDSNFNYNMLVKD
jgi:hypothetical protein